MCLMLFFLFFRLRTPYCRCSQRAYFRVLRVLVGFRFALLCTFTLRLRTWIHTTYIRTYRHVKAFLFIDY